MNISVTVEIDNRKFGSFEELEKFGWETGLIIGQKIIRAGLELKDKQLAAERDTKRYRDKGLRKTSIKTRSGTVEYRRRVYTDLCAEAGESRTVYLLDESMGLEKIGNCSPGLCKLVASAVCRSSYRGGASEVSDLSGQTISAQGAWDIVQELGRRQHRRAEQNAKLAKASQGRGTIETPILYEEGDGIWLHLQGESRRQNGRSKEMKVGIAYDGVRWIENEEGKKRRILNNKIAYAGFETAKEFRRNKEGLVASRFKTETIKLRVVNGDGASWIQKAKGEKKITVLDAFHRNKKIRECVKDPEKAELIAGVLHEGDADALLEYIEAAIESVTEEEEASGLQELYDYYKENKESLSGYYDRGIEIPPTREPGVLHHARLGSMESNVFTLIGNRMKGRRFNWSIEGANNLSIILCAYHTTGMEGLFAEMPGDPVEKEVWKDEGRPLQARENPLSIGKGYDYPVGASTQAGPCWLKDIARIGGIDGLKIIY